MPIEFDVHITEKLLLRVALRRILHRWPLTLLALVLVGVGVYLDSGSRYWSAASIVGMTAAGFMLLVYLAYYLRQRRAIADWKRMQGDAPVHYRLTEEALHAQSNLGASELKWTVFRELVEYRDCVLLGFSRHSHFTLPRVDVPAEALDFLRRKFQELKLPIKRA
jgi:hypothetical protein